MSDERVTYVDSSALVKLAVKEPESMRLHRYLRRRVLVASALARVEVARALLPLGDAASRNGQAVLERIQLVRVNDRVIRDAGSLEPAALRSLDAIHLATARMFGPSLAVLVTYDERMAVAARGLGIRVTSPG